MRPKVSQILLWCTFHVRSVMASRFERGMIYVGMSDLVCIRAMSVSARAAENSDRLVEMRIIYM